MFTSTLNDIKGERYDALEVVTANAVVSYDSYSYRDNIKEAMDRAIGQLSSQAGKMGADGVIGVTFIISKQDNGTRHVSAYGTAIKYTENCVDESDAERPKYYKK